MSDTEKQIVMMTTTNEVFLPTRLVYEVYQERPLREFLGKQSCIGWDPEKHRWTWEYEGAALKLKFSKEYSVKAEKNQPVVLASCYLTDPKTLHAYTRCGLRAVKFLSFFDQYVPRTVAKAKFIDQYNFVTAIKPDEPMPIPEDYFKDESKIEFFDIMGLLDAQETPEKKASLAALCAGFEQRALAPLERHRLDMFYEDGVTSLELSMQFRETMAMTQYKSGKPLRPFEFIQAIVG